ncbi:MAG: hypothetical protein ABUS56_05010 [Acidobacteriota bacterium]
MPADSVRQSASADVPPTWVGTLLGVHDTTQERGGPGADGLRIARGVDFTLVTATIPDAVDLPREALQQRVSDAYEAVLETVAAEGRHAIRFWNFIPRLHTAMASGLDRYMVFNSGRFLAYSRRASTPGALARALPTASGVGSSASALTIHCLAGPMPGRSIEHPRQIPAYQYSFRYGPHPPCFARATLVAMPGDGEPRLLVGGTASVRGEDSMHDARLAAQVDETLANLASIVSAAAAAIGSERGAPAPETSVADSLRCFTDLRVYLPRLEDRPEALALLAPRFPGVSQIEVVPADLCRRELVVEIEGVAAPRG